MNKRSGYLLGIAVLAFTVLAPPRADAWTVQVTGTILKDSGDGFGLFGTANTSLVGDAYSETITTDPNLNSAAQCGTASCLARTGTAPYTLTVTVDGVSFVHTELAPAYNISILEDGLNAHDPMAPFDLLSQSVISANCGTSLTGVCIAAGFEALSSTTPFVPKLSFNQNITVAGGASFNPTSSFAGFDMFGGARDQETAFYGSIDSLSVKAVGVPEPGTIALLGVGLATIALVRRRRRVLAVATV